MPAVIAAADMLLAGEWPIFHLQPASVGEVPDWFRDPSTGRASAPRYLRLHREVSRRGFGREHQVCLGAVAASGDDGARVRLVADRRRALRRASPRAPRLLVGRQPVPHRRALDQRHRGRRAPAVLELDPRAAGRVARRLGVVRRQRPLHHPALRPSALHPPLAERRFVREQPRHRRVGRRSPPPAPHSPGSPRATPGARGRGAGLRSKPTRRRTRTGSTASRPATIMCSSSNCSPAPR